MTDPIRSAKIFSTALQSVSPVQGAKKEAGDPTPDQLRSACRDFESIFIQQMMQQMRRTVPQDGLFNGGQAEQMYTSMLDGELSKSFAQQRGLGLSDVLYRQLSALQYGEKDNDP